MRMKKKPIDLIKEKIFESQSIAITSHLRPDGDSLCTGLAFYFMAKQLKKDVQIINKDIVPFPFNNIPDIENIKIGQIPPQGFDLVLLLECANVKRSGQNNLGGYFKINIDHHYSNDYYADINWVEPEAAAVGCMAYELGQKLLIKFTPQIATHLYCAIVSDTGSFQFSNTRARSLEVCSELIKYGANPVSVSDFLFNNNPPEKIKLLGQVLSTLRMNSEGNIAIITMFKSFLDSLPFPEIDTEDITTMARSIKNVEMVLFLKEMEDGVFRISIRSKGSSNAAYIAESFGGGGHIHASGFKVKGDYNKLIQEIPVKVTQLLKQYKEKERDKAI